MLTTKEHEWQEVGERVAHLVDKLGRGIDPHIVDTVIALNALGIETSQSCEGHLDHGRPYPWITFDVREAAHVFLQSGEANRQKTYQEAQALKRQAETIQGYEQGKIVNLLTTFYAHREVGYYRSLIVYPRNPGTLILESQGAMCLIGEPADRQKVGLVMLQDEMQSFADFLKNEFFNS